MAGGCVRGDAQGVGEDDGLCLADELVPCGEPACPGRYAQLVKDDDEPAVAAMFAGELPAKQPGRDRVGGGGHVAAVAQVVPEQGGDGLGNVEPVRAELELGGFIGARDLADAQGGDPAGLLGVEHNQAVGDAVFEGEGVVEQQPADRRSRCSGADGGASASVWITGSSAPRRMRWCRACR